MMDFARYHERFLLSKLRNGDEEAFNCIFYTYYRGLVVYAYNFLMDRDIAEETVQGVFVKIWSLREELRIETSLRAYLQKSVKNKCLDMLKHKRIVRDYIDKPGMGHDDYENSSDDLILLNELKEKIEFSINNLPENCGKAFRLSRFEGLKYEEIARKMDISVKTVETHIGKALKQLREDLKEYLQE